MFDDDDKSYSPSLVDYRLVKALEALVMAPLVWVEVEFRDGTGTQGVITYVDAGSEKVRIDSNFAKDGDDYVPDVTEFSLTEVYRFTILLVSREQGSLQNFA